MHPAIFRGFQNELCKIAVVQMAVKQYRRAAEGFERASRSAMKDPVRQIPREGFAVHGTDALPKIINSGRLIASPLGETGQHGAGVYWWKGFPHGDYMRGLQDEGLLSSLGTLPNKRPPVPNISGGHMNLKAQVTGPGDYKIRGPHAVPVPNTPSKFRPQALLDAGARRTGLSAKTRLQSFPADTAVMDMATRANNKTLTPLLADAAERRVRVMDTSLFHRARQRLRDINPYRGKSVVPSTLGSSLTKRELMNLYSRRLAGHLG